MLSLRGRLSIPQAVAQQKLTVYIDIEAHPVHAYVDEELTTKFETLPNAAELLANAVCIEMVNTDGTIYYPINKTVSTLLGTYILILVGDEGGVTPYEVEFIGGSFGGLK